MQLRHLVGIFSLKDATHAINNKTLLKLISLNNYLSIDPFTTPEYGKTSIIK